MYSWKIIHGKHKRIALQSLINSYAAGHNTEILIEHEVLYLQIVHDEIQWKNLDTKNLFLIP